MNAFAAALLAALERVDTPTVRSLTDDELKRLAEELDTAALFVRHEQQWRALSKETNP
jgi:arsenate reductase-like glutaredoxin family protein